MTSRTGATSRRKGLAGEREARDLFAAYGFELRGLEGSGDWMAFGHVCRCDLLTDAIRSRRVDFHVEVKRYRDRARYPEWWDQARTEAPVGVPPLLCTRADRGDWLVMALLQDFLEAVR